MDRDFYSRWDYSEDAVKASLFYDGLSHPARITILEGRSEGKTYKDIAQDVGMSPTGLSNHKNKLRNTYLCVSPESGGPWPTPLGQYALGDTIEPSRVVAVYDMLEEQENRIEKERESVREGSLSPVAEDLLEKIDVNRLIWELENTWEEAKKILGVEEMYWEPESGSDSA